MEKVIARAISKDPEHRFSSAAAMTLALEDVITKTKQGETRDPYPGLSAFTTDDAKFFFGRELELESILKKLEELHLLAIIGPSGSGKTSLLQAGLIPALNEEWGHVFCQPGDSPFVNLAQAFVNEFSGDTDAMRKMLHFEETDSALHLLRRWRQNYKEALIIVDRFEELFTLNPPDTQSRFAELLGHAALDADVRVLLVMRDDFLMKCQGYSSLQPIFSELTGLLPLIGSALRQALIHPATECGYRFEDDALAEEILADVEKERGVLPLMAFTASRLWEKRDREHGILTRKAYQEIGGVAGALAQHAEATMDRIGESKHDIVREIFRNLITAQGTRAARDIEELLSVFPNRKDAEEVLRTLVDARLLTSFETKQEGKNRVEIIHESLLTAWPRLVRWQTQDADSIQLRDQLRQAAHLWEDRGKPSELLWSGASYKEFELWRDRYAGNLSAIEESFAQAMTHEVGKRRRQRRFAIGATFIILLSLLAAIAKFWRDAISEADRSEAGKLISLGRLELNKDRSVALAYAIASLEQSDTSEARRFAVEILNSGPTAVTAAMPINPASLDFSPDGNWLAAGGFMGLRLLQRDGKKEIQLPEPAARDTRAVYPQFAPNSDFLVWRSRSDRKVFRVWSISQQKEVRTLKMEGVTFGGIKCGRLFLFTDATGNVERTGQWEKVIVRMWSFDPGDPQVIGRWNRKDIAGWDIDQNCRWLVFGRGKGIYLRPLDSLDKGPERLVGEHTENIGIVNLSINNQVISSDTSGEVRIWSLSSDSRKPIRIISGKDPMDADFDPTGSLAWVSYSADQNVKVFRLNGPDDADPLIFPLKYPISAVGFDPSGEWLSLRYDLDRITLWPVLPKYPFIIHENGHFGSEGALAVTPNGKSIVSSSVNGELRIRQFPGYAPTSPRVVWRANIAEVRGIDIDSTGKYAIVGTSHEGANLVLLEDGTSRQLPGTQPGQNIVTVAFSPDGRFAAGAPQWGPESDRGIRLWDLKANSVKILEQSKGKGFMDMQFSSDHKLFTAGMDGTVTQWDLVNDTNKIFEKNKGLVYSLALSKDGNHLVATSCEQAVNRLQDMNMKIMTSKLKVYDLRKGTSYVITSHGNRTESIALDPTGKILITGDADGIVRVGPITGEDPHLLLGHGADVCTVAVDPTGEWIASAEFEHPILRLWPMPKGKPFHALAYKEFMLKLRSLTNVRVIEDQKSSNGYRITFDTFPGWEKVPTW